VLREEGPSPCSIWAKQGTSLQHTDLICIVQWTQLYILTNRLGPLTPGLFPSATIRTTKAKWTNETGQGIWPIISSTLYVFLSESSQRQLDLPKPGGSVCPRPRRPRYNWMGVTGSGPLQVLHHKQTWPLLQ
jgi:hypothetical protein